MYLFVYLLFFIHLLSTFEKIKLSIFLLIGQKQKQIYELTRDYQKMIMYQSIAHKMSVVPC